MAKRRKLPERGQPCHQVPSQQGQPRMSRALPGSSDMGVWQSCSSVAVHQPGECPHVRVTTAPPESLNPPDTASLSQHATVGFCPEGWIQWPGHVTPGGPCSLGCRTHTHSWSCPCGATWGEGPNDSEPRGGFGRWPAQRGRMADLPMRVCGIEVPPTLHSELWPRAQARAPRWYRDAAPACLPACRACVPTLTPHLEERAPSPTDSTPEHAKGVPRPAGP